MGERQVELLKRAWASYFGAEAEWAAIPADFVAGFRAAYDAALADAQVEQATDAAPDLPARSGEAEGERVERVRADEVQQGERIWADEAFREVVRTVEDEGVIELWAAERTLLDSLPGDYFVLRLSHPEPRQDQPVDRASCARSSDQRSSEGPTTSAVEHRRSETEVAGSSPAGRSQVEHPKTGERAQAIDKCLSCGLPRLPVLSGQIGGYCTCRVFMSERAVEHAPEPLQDGGERERVAEAIFNADYPDEDQPFSAAVEKEKESYLRCADAALATVARRHPHQDVERLTHERDELEGVAEEALGNPIKTEKSFVAVLAENYRFQLENAAKLVQARREVERLREHLRAIVDLLPAEETALTDAVRDVALSALAPSPDDRGGER